MGLIDDYEVPDDTAKFGILRASELVGADDDLVPRLKGWT